MHPYPSIVCVIPARLNSSRFPEKVLKFLAGKPILQWVYEKAQMTQCFDEIYFAIDNEKTAKLIETFGGKWVMTEEECPSGTMRLISLRKKIKKSFDLWLNWQADEPLLEVEMVRALIASVDEKSDVFTLKKKISVEEASKANIVKVVSNKDHEAMYFSRAIIPFERDGNTRSQYPYFKHIGLYLYKDASLDAIEHFQPCEYEIIEKLEQLTFLYNNLKIKVIETSFESIGIDYQEDLIAAEKYLFQHS